MNYKQMLLEEIRNNASEIVYKNCCNIAKIMPDEFFDLITYSTDKRQIYINLLKDLPKFHFVMVHSTMTPLQESWFKLAFKRFEQALETGNNFCYIYQLYRQIIKQARLYPKTNKIEELKQIIEKYTDSTDTTNFYETSKLIYNKLLTKFKEICKKVEDNRLSFIERFIDISYKLHGNQTFEFCSLAYEQDGVFDYKRIKGNEDLLLDRCFCYFTKHLSQVAFPIYLSHYEGFFGLYSDHFLDTIEYMVLLEDQHNVLMKIYKQWKSEVNRGRNMNQLAKKYEPMCLEAIRKFFSTSVHFDILSDDLISRLELGKEYEIDFVDATFIPESYIISRGEKYIDAYETAVRIIEFEKQLRLNELNELSEELVGDKLSLLWKRMRGEGYYEDSDDNETDSEGDEDFSSDDSDDESSDEE